MLEANSICDSYDSFLTHRRPTMTLLKQASYCLCHLGGYVVGHIVGAEGAARIVGFTKEHFTAHNRKLRQALAHSHERAWKALAVALAGDSLIDKGKRLFASGDDKDFREHVHAFLERAPLPVAATSIQFRQACLAEYKGLSGHLTPAADAVDVADLGHAAQKLREFADTQGQLQAAWQAVEAVANGLAADCPK